MTLEEFNARLATLPDLISLVVAQTIREHGETIAEEAASRMGTQQSGWKPLTQSTIAKHGDTPRFDGSHEGVHDKYSVTSVAVDSPGAAFAVSVGSEQPQGLFQEIGTSRGLPPRPVLVPALVAHHLQFVDNIDTAIGEAIDKVFG